MIELARAAVPASSLTVHELVASDARGERFVMTASGPVE